MLNSFFFKLNGCVFRDVFKSVVLNSNDLRSEYTYSTAKSRDHSSPEFESTLPTIIYTSQYTTLVHGRKRLH